MGNKISHCFATSSPIPRRRVRRHVSAAAVTSEPDGLGHSFCYVSSKAPEYSISGAAVSANAATALSTTLSLDSTTTTTTKGGAQSPSAAAAFESSLRFSSIPLQPIPRFLSGPLADDHRAFLSGPIERSFLSGPILPKPIKRRRLLSLRNLSHAISRTLGVRKVSKECHSSSVDNSSGFISVDEAVFLDKQWAQGKAGEDRVHVVIDEEDKWVFVGIYDGFNGPDATDYLLTNLYSEVHTELQRLDLGEGRSHGEVMKSLSRALSKTEETFLDCADMMASENPELALMGSCVLVMLMVGEDVYVMNVGDSRAVLATKGRRVDADVVFDELLSLDAVQLTFDHSTSVDEEVARIRNEHLDDPLAITNDRVKGSLKVTRAFGAGFLKQPKWNDALLEMFRIDYVGASPYITCNPFIHHHRLDADDKFLILSSDGLYQYFTNEEAVAEVELFIATTPEGDPAQHLLEELIFRAAKKAGMDFHELLEIPQGDRRRYHDDVSVIVISLEGRIWRSCV